MSLHAKDDNARVTLATIGTFTDDVVDADPFVLITEDLYQRREFSGGSDATADNADDYITLAFRNGEVVRKSEVTGMLTAAVVDAITPSTGLATAGGTTLTAVGLGLDGVSGVTVGGTAATSVNVVNPRRVTFVTPAKAAGTYTVVFTDDSGTVTKTSAVTFA